MKLMEKLARDSYFCAPLKQKLFPTHCYRQECEVQYVAFRNVNLIVLKIPDSLMKVILIKFPRFLSFNFDLF